MGHFIEAIQGKKVILDVEDRALLFSLAHFLCAGESRTLFFLCFFFLFSFL